MNWSPIIVHLDDILVDVLFEKSHRCLPTFEIVVHLLGIRVRMECRLDSTRRWILDQQKLYLAMHSPSYERKPRNRGAHLCKRESQIGIVNIVQFEEPSG